MCEKSCVVKEVCVRKIWAAKFCVCERTECVTKLRVCVCVTKWYVVKLCAIKLYVTKLCDTSVCVCDKDVSERWCACVCVTKLLVTKLCV